MAPRDLFNHAALRRRARLNKSRHIRCRIYFSITINPRLNSGAADAAWRPWPPANYESVAGDAGDSVLVSLGFSAGLELHERRGLRRRLSEDVLAIELL